MYRRHVWLLAALSATLFVNAIGAAGAEPQVPIPQPARDRYDEGQALEKQGRLREALSAYQEAIGLGMQLFPRAHLKEAKAYLELREFDSAIARYTKFIDGFGLEDSCRY
jgi:tetratricopeptide (TPR) repeat protein